MLYIGLQVSAISLPKNQKYFSPNKCLFRKSYFLAFISRHRLPAARREQLKAVVWERKLKQFESLVGLQKKVSDHNSGPSVWQFTLAVEHWIKMDAAEILQGKCAYADAKWVVAVGISMHQVSSPPLLALKPQPSCMGGKLALAAGSSWAVLLLGDSPYDQCMDT